jgi:GTP cyclohydrolase I
MNLSARKLGGSDIDLFNPCGDHITHFVGCAEIPYAPNSF